MTDKHVSNPSATTRVVLDIPFILESLKSNPQIRMDDALGELDAGIKAMLELLPESQASYSSKTMDSYLWVIEMLLSCILEIVREYEVKIHIDSMSGADTVKSINEPAQFITEFREIFSVLCGEARNDSGAE